MVTTINKKLTMKYFRIPRDERPTVQEMALITLIEREGLYPHVVRLYDEHTNKVERRTIYKIKPHQTKEKK